MKSSSPSARATDPSPTSVLSLSALLFLRGGQQDQDTVATSDETASLDASSVNMKRYDSHATDDSVAAADVEMTGGGDGDPTTGESVVAEEATSASPPSEPSSSAASSSPRNHHLSALAPASALLRAAGGLYSRQLTSRPVLTKSLTAGIIFGMSDWCAQLIELGEGDEVEESEGGGGLVLSRILASFLVGLLFFGPAANAWYGMIFKILPSTSLISTLQKAALGQIFFGPAFTCVFFAAGMIQSGAFSLGAWMGKIRSDLPGVWASGLGYWPLVDFISYKVVPVKWIPLFVNFCSFVWTIYLSLVANRGKGAEDGVEGDVE